MYAPNFAQTIEEPWTALEPILLGDVPSGRGTPDIYCLLTKNGYPEMRIDVYGQGMAFPRCRFGTRGW